MGNIDRRILYLIAFLVMGLPLFMEFPLPVAKNKRSLDLYNAIEAVDQSQGGKIIIISANFSPDTRGESIPQAQALIRHMLIAGKKFAIWTFNSTSAPGQELANTEAQRIAEELKRQGIQREYGRDWVNLGYKVANAPVMEGMARNIPGFFRTDSRGTPVADVPMMQGVKTARDLGLVIDVSPSATYRVWIPAVTAKYDIPLVLAPTSVMVPDTYPYLMSGQVRGELRGVLGAAEYESLLNSPGTGTRVMTSIAALNAYIVLLILIGNIAYFRSRRTQGGAQ